MQPLAHLATVIPADGFGIELFMPVAVVLSLVHQSAGALMALSRLMPILPDSPPHQSGAAKLRRSALLYPTAEV